jgi:hypothetical protein
MRNQENILLSRELSEIIEKECEKSTSLFEVFDRASEDARMCESAI